MASDVGILGPVGRDHDLDDVGVLGAALVILGLGVRWLIQPCHADRPDPALDILCQRYAKGEINREEFETKRRDLVQ